MNFGVSARRGLLAGVLFLTACTSMPGQDISTVLDPDVSRASETTGRNHFVAGNYGLAEKHFRKAVELRATNGNAWMGLAASYDRLGRFDMADRAYQQAIKVSGRTPKLINNMGYSQLLRGNTDEARKLLNEAHKLMPNDPVVKANLALLDKR